MAQTASSALSLLADHDTQLSDEIEARRQLIVLLADAAERQQQQIEALAAAAEETRQLGAAAEAAKGVVEGLQQQLKDRME